MSKYEFGPRSLPRRHGLELEEALTLSSKLDKHNKKKGIEASHDINGSIETGSTISRTPGSKVERIKPQGKHQE